ncbi:RodZ domain-containing protein [Acidovorax sp. 106]|jgi:cytoskeleton protein RodZ|uniref:RodZ domain-containing protein n=1 Tax=Acidovorax sp. 106 TaxID=2135637 RepID=UPI000EAE2210|nr:RodZ domain-containing protein [Acidovorax sp. 106]RLJ36710.1 cytoskeleton protein RodZ [Acidovorax sp. 106]
MSESTVALASAQDGATQPTAGEILRSAREAAGVHIEALAVALKVPVSKLEALESNRLELLPDTVFMRALASSVCRTLKLDPAQVLSLLPQSKNPRLIPERSDINTPVKSVAGKTFVSNGGSRHSSWLMFGVFVLLIGAAAVFYWPAGFQPWNSRPLSLVGSAAVPTSGQEASASKTEEIVAVVQPPVAAEPAPAASSTAALVPVAPSPAVAQPASAALPAIADTSAALLMLRARGDSWVQVRDATGRVVFEKKLASGDAAPVSGVLPLSVVVGRADVTDVFVRGKPLELNAVSRENVARFEVK